MYGGSCVLVVMRLAPALAALTIACTGASATPRVTQAAPLGDPAATGAITKVEIVAAVGDAIATERPAYARKDQAVLLYAAIQVDGKAWFSDAPVLQLGGKRIAAQPLAKAPRHELAWKRIEPSEANI